MLRKLRQDEKGFTLIELLVVILIIGILAAIALPTFLGQQKKGQDASTKSDVRNAVSQVESCYVDEQNYANCLNASSAMADANLNGVTVTVPSGQAFKAEKTGGSGNTFTITKSTSGTYSRSCTTAGKGGCKADGTW